jgi:mannitol 2-dehydrogenase
LCYFAHLKGHRLVHEACLEPDMAVFLRRFMDEEATPTLDPLPGVDLDAYKTELIERFQNPEVKDTVARLCTDSSDRIPKWLLDVVRERLAADEPVTLSAAIVASWARYAEGVDEQGAPIEVVDPLRDELMAIASRQHEHIDAFIANRDLFGDLIDAPPFREAYVATLQSLHDAGSAETLHSLAHGQDLAELLQLSSGVMRE